MSRSDFAFLVVCGIVAAGIYKAAESSYRKTKHLIVLVDQARLVAEKYPNDPDVNALDDFAERSAKEFDLDHVED